MAARLIERVLKDHWLMLLGSVACLVFAFAFAELGGEVHEGNLREADHAVRAWMRGVHTDGGHRAFSLLTRLGDRVVLLPLALALGWPLLRGYWSWLVLLLFTALASAELVSILKNGFEVLRPPIGLQHSKSFAFPSGHATAAATVAAVLGYLSLHRGIAPLAYIAGGSLVVLIVGFTRMYLDMHWFSDVVGGILIGSTFAIGCCALYQWLQLAFTTIRRRRPATNRLLPD